MSSNTYSSFQEISSGARIFFNLYETFSIIIFETQLKPQMVTTKRFLRTSITKLTSGYLLTEEMCKIMLWKDILITTYLNLPLNVKTIKYYFYTFLRDC